MSKEKHIQLISGLPQTDWNETDTTKPSYLKNKPTTVDGYGITDAATLDESGRVPSTQLPVSLQELNDISGASAGQIASVAAVDDNGKPTKWTTSELPEGAIGPAGIVVSESEPTDESHPVWVRPSGQSGAVDLGITGATVGQVVIVNEVDTSGKPTKWTAGDVASDQGGMEWTKLGDVIVNGTAEFIPLSFESGIVTIDTSSENYAALPSSYNIACVVHTIDITSKTSPGLGLLKPLDYDAGTFEFYNRDSAFQSSAAYDPARYKISIMNVGAVVMENIPTDYKRYKCRVTTPVYSTHGIRSRWNCNGFEAMSLGADSSVCMGGGAIVEIELYRFPYDENYMYKRTRVAYGNLYGGGSNNEFQAFELISSGAGQTKPSANGKISFSPYHMLFVNGTQFELWGTNND